MKNRNFLVLTLILAVFAGGTALAQADKSRVYNAPKKTQQQKREENPAASLPPAEIPPEMFMEHLRKQYGECTKADTKALDDFDERMMALGDGEGRYDRKDEETMKILMDNEQYGQIFMVYLRCGRTPRTYEYSEEDLKKSLEAYEKIKRQ